MEIMGRSVSADFWGEREKSAVFIANNWLDLFWMLPS